jgi:pyruvate/2-oxoglutarate dehydrogenase complex dihydrolipoamide dehydrogenase (E3) component
VREVRFGRCVDRDVATRDFVVAMGDIGVGGDEAIHSILDMMYADRTYTTLQRAVHIHPTVAELIPTPLGSLKPAEPTG